MTHARSDLHVYLRDLEQGKRTSLSVLAGLIAPGSAVLDLGTGSGALGKHLRENAGCIVDGVTINEQEAAIARPHYRRIVVADLEEPDWSMGLEGQRYDYIVCADVLEHLREPAAALRVCRDLLLASGKVLISVPNAAYAGLISELLRGDFTYRDEGLLDRTHLRFFTRRSLLQFLAAQGWSVDAVEPVHLPLNESEFKLPFDQLPPAVASHLLALPDAGTYQLVVAAHPGQPGVAHVAGIAASETPIAALFSAELYVDHGAGFQEGEKLVVAGVIGKERQVLRFEVPPGERPPAGLRLDPADRPGFLRLYRIALTAGHRVLWQWRCEIDGLEALQSASHQDMLLRSPWPSSAALVLLHGDDPSLVLPVPDEALRACAGAGGAVLEVELGWPMSSDYMALVETVQPLREQLRSTTEESRVETERARMEAQQARLATEQAQRDTGAAREAHRQAEHRVQELSDQLQTLKQYSKRLSDDKELLARQKLAAQASQAEVVRMYDALAAHLRWIENSTVFRATRPLVRAKMSLQRMMGNGAAEPAPPAPLARPVDPAVDTVDVIVPVYKGLDDTRLCIQSVLASRCETRWRLVVLNDASPEPEVTEWLRQASAADSRIVLLENEENLGFVGTVNRGMALSDTHDVLLLNSDTEVANDWLDRLRRAAYSDARVASVTPFSNNATICSYPRFCEPNELPPDCDTASLDRLFAAANAGQVVDVPTGVGFCMYVRRDCLNAVGLFDVQNFGKGYGEENDFCRRAAEAGWRNLHALDTFVLHTGGVSFGDSKSQREREAVEKLRRLHPSYDRIVHDFVIADPARTARLAVDLARVRSRGLPGVLAVLHDRSGGTLRHVGELAAHLRHQAVFFSLTPAPGNAVRLEWVEPGAGFRAEFTLPGEWDALLKVLRGLGIVHVHYHHVLGHRDEILALGEQLGVPWDFTAHDFYSMCPQISLTGNDDRYCGEDGSGTCKRCVPNAPAPAGLDIAGWRARNGRLLTQARHVLAPSRDAALRFARMWPSADVRLAPHTDVVASGELPVRPPAPLQQGACLKVVVIGAISRIKGADVLEDVAALAARAGAPVEFHLIGHAYRELLKQPKAALTVHGPYQDDDLPDLLNWIKPDLVWFPALWPETYSYTLSAAMLAGLPIVAPDIGSFPERLNGRRWSWVMPWETPAQAWLGFFRDVREKHFMTGRSPEPFVRLAIEGDGVIGGWSYETDYLRHVEPASQPSLDPAFLAQHGPGRGTGIERQRRLLKRLTLSALVRLRSAPPLRLVSRALPLRLQTRVKTWLRA